MCKLALLVIAKSCRFIRCRVWWINVANFFEAPICVATLCRHTKTLTFPRFIFQPSETLEAELYEVLIYGYGQAKLKSRAGQTQALSGPCHFQLEKFTTPKMYDHYGPKTSSSDVCLICSTFEANKQQLNPCRQTASHGPDVQSVVVHEIS
jgi:hypothetical protein